MSKVYTDITHDPTQGETKAQMEHAKELKAFDSDTSVDAPFEIEVGVKCVFFFLPMILFQFPSVLIIRTYMYCLPYGTKSINRSSCGFIMTFLLALFLHVPMFLFIAMNYIMDVCFYYTFSLLYYTFTCTWPNYTESQKAIKPYRGGPSLLCNIMDVFVAIFGQVHRQGLFEMTYLLVMMYLVLPTLKYYVNCNPIIYNLHESFVQQISTSMGDMPVSDVADTVRAIISNAKQDDAENTEIIDKWKFIPHYPYPPKHKHWAVGMQVGGICSLFVHTTHAKSVSDKSNNEESMFILSNSVEVPIYRVMLWYNNPYHFLTGFVEASGSNGQKSQPDKMLGGEHPMWIVTSHSTALNHRFEGWSGPGMIDNFFDKWLPTFVYEVRRRLRGKEAADELKEEVISKDGISRPAGTKQVKMRSEA